MLPLGSRWVLCEKCYKPILAPICVDGSQVYYHKKCSCTASFSRESRTLISTDSDYFITSHGPLATGNRPPIENGGKNLALVLEVTDDCNLRCPTCIAGSAPGAGNYRSITDLYKMIDIAAESGRDSILMISGGEPTIHPEIVRVIERACDSKCGRVFLITNGVRIARDPKFVHDIARLNKRLEVYLQFDSLIPEVTFDIRGEDLSAIRRGAVQALDDASLSMTLVCVVKRGLNDHDVAEVVRFAQQFRYVRGVTFQPIKAMGRNPDLNPDKNLIMMTDVRRKIHGDLDGCLENSLMPHPASTENIALGYFIRSGGKFDPVSDEFIAAAELDLNSSLFLLPHHKSLVAGYDSYFRVAIVSFMDKYNFSFELIPSCLVSFVTEQGFKVPLDLYYLKREIGRYPGQ